MRHWMFAPRGGLPTKQSGLTLVVGLILLAILTLVGVIGFRNVTMSQRMATNAWDRNIGFQAAESAGKEALTAITTGSVAGAGYYPAPLAKGGNSDYWTQGDGAPVSNPALCASQTKFSWKSCAKAASKYAGNASQSQYVIELLNTTSYGTSTVSSYRVTSRSKGGSGDADVVLQTIYNRVDP